MGTSCAPTFAYQDSLYFLTQGNGPWGNRAWTYDKIGNRLTFARTSEPTQSYAYSGTGHNPKLATITPAPGLGTGSWIYSYDPAGNQTSIVESDDEGAAQTTFYDVTADGRMNTLRTDTGPSRTDFLYDGRGYLRQGLLTVTGSTDNLSVTPVYSSEGTLMARTEVRQFTGSTIGPDGEDQDLAQMSNETTQLFYFAGRPVAQLTSGSELLFLTTDHLGTPVLATDTSGAAVWAGGVEPFGRTWTAGPDNPDPESAAGGSGPIGQAAAPALGTLASEKVFLRYPGQWASDAFRVTGTQEEIYYNLQRWYAAGMGRYTQVDPWGLSGGGQLYSYALSNPSLFSDPTGEVVSLRCRPIGSPTGNIGFQSAIARYVFGAKHCFLEVNCGSEVPPTLISYGVGNPRVQVVPNYPTSETVNNDVTFSRLGRFREFPVAAGTGGSCCSFERCVVDLASSLNASRFQFDGTYSVIGPNSNSFAHRVIRECGGRLGVPVSEVGQYGAYGVEFPGNVPLP